MSRRGLRRLIWGWIILQNGAFCQGILRKPPCNTVLFVTLYHPVCYGLQLFHCILYGITLIRYLKHRDIVDGISERHYPAA